MIHVPGPNAAELIRAWHGLAMFAVLCSRSLYNVSCKWVQQQQQRWTEWMPIETNCFEGFGLIDANGNFVSNRSGQARLVASLFWQENG